MKSLISYVNEALYEIDFAIGETVQFIPTAEQCNAYNLQPGVKIIGVVDSVKIDNKTYLYTISNTNLRIVCIDVPNENVFQDVRDIFLKQ